MFFFLQWFLLGRNDSHDFKKALVGFSSVGLGLKCDSIFSSQVLLPFQSPVFFFNFKGNERPTPKKASLSQLYIHSEHPVRQASECWSSDHGTNDILIRRDLCLWRNEQRLILIGQSCKCTIFICFFLHMLFGERNACFPTSAKYHFVAKNCFHDWVVGPSLDWPPESIVPTRAWCWGFADGHVFTMTLSVAGAVLKLLQLEAWF